MKNHDNAATAKLLHGDLTARILKIFFTGSNELGPGFLEAVYCTALEQALGEEGLAVEAQRRTDVFFRGRRIGYFTADLVVENLVVLELKAVRFMVSDHFAQLINFLCASNLEVGLVLNFGRGPEFKRVVYSNRNKKALPR